MLASPVDVTFETLQTESLWWKVKPQELDESGLPAVTLNQSQLKQQYGTTLLAKLES
jgi:nucleolar MIF4G domain-containing protein 1